MSIFVLLKLDNVSLSLANADVLSHVIGHNCCLAEWTCVIKEHELARKSKTACVWTLILSFRCFCRGHSGLRGTLGQQD